MIYNVLKSIDKDYIIGIGTYDIDPKKQLTGYISNLTAESFHFKIINDTGIVDEEIEQPVSEIISIETDTMYQNDLDYIFKGNLNTKTNQGNEINSDNVNFIPNLEKLKSKSAIVTFFLRNDEDDNYGVILDYDNSNIIITEINIYGENEGLSCYNLDCVESIRFDSSTERKIEILYKRKENKE